MLVGGRGRATRRSLFSERVRLYMRALCCADISMHQCYITYCHDIEQQTLYNHVVRCTAGSNVGERTFVCSIAFEVTIRLDQSTLDTAMAACVAYYFALNVQCINIHTNIYILGSYTDTWPR